LKKQKHEKWWGGGGFFVHLTNAIRKKVDANSVVN